VKVLLDENLGGFYKRGCQEKTLHLICRGRYFSRHPAPVGSRNTLFEGMVLFFTFVGGSRGHILSRSSSGFFCACKQRVAIANHGSI
jgi:hypothetical protein